VSDRDKAVAAVVAATTTDDYGSVDSQPDEDIGDAPAGVFHKHDARHAVLFDGAAIELA
jgi:hypothetical protein